MRITTLTRQSRGTRHLITSVALAGIATLAACAEHTAPVEPNPLPPDGPSRLVVATTGTYTEIAAGASSTCGLRTDGVINCWGDNSYGQAPATRSAVTGKFTAVTAYFAHTCALRTDGVVECWGSNDYGESPATVTPPAGKTFIAVDVGTQHGCALRNDGVIQCWGDNGYGQAPATRSATTGTFTALSAGGAHTCGLRTDGVIECWGADSPATKTATTGRYVRATGRRLVCGIRDDGVLECFLAPPVEGTFTDYAEYIHACGLRTDGVIVCRGNNDKGQAPATRTAATGSYTRVVVGFDFSCALRTDGKIECWGNRDGAAYDHVQPTATFTAPASVIVGQAIALAISNAQVPGYPSATTFTYAFDCGTGFGLSSSATTASCPTTASGTRTVAARVIDQDNDFTTYSATVTVKSAQQGTTDLAAAISAASLSPDLRKALLAKLNAALDAIAKGKTSTACSALADFINQVNAQRGKAIPTTTADAWILTATQLKTAAGC